MIINMDAAILKSLAYLSSSTALQSIERDPYWPKWDGPWWHMLLLHEMELVKEIPVTIISKMVAVLKNHYLPIFPVKQEELPAIIDPYRQLACHCAVGSIYQVLFDYGVEVDFELPWMRPWMLRYQLPDGGLNCDEQAYTRPVPKSSIVSTLPCLEAILFCHRGNLTPQETVFLDHGANYLLKQRLFRKVSSGEVIRQDWCEVKFPRFYEYDFLRGFYFLSKWREKSGLSISDELVDEVELLVAKQMTSDGRLKLKRYNLFDKRSYNPDQNGSWAWGQASEFDLMKSVSFDGGLCSPLSKKWNEVKLRTATVIESYETIYKNPIKLKVGESVRIEKRETNPEWLGWVYCVDARGIAGWVCEKYLKESGPTAVVTRAYDATELTVNSGEQLKVYYEESGWCWCRNKDGGKGWIPIKNVTI